ncbi:hypothetical protein CDD80_4320 [Ophiocordyceps camponoti-rufipedis]|uniref:Uncharacterized protein n=1 Tax=Ophiocordyceps camponoti-rufipedis TaxID=2004952 RepID=A0A2C5ZLX0_9HYPO|nr:hypothetical protein CDD80_4320 [Ophiocordyceps camponoti-rufipedis]
MTIYDEIAYRTQLAAVNKGSNIRLYVVDVDGGIREIVYDGKWSGGTSSNVITRGKVDTPLAATSLDLDHIRLFYVGADNKGKEYGLDKWGKWHQGGFSNSGFKLASFSGGIAAICLGGNRYKLRVFAQLEDESIQEFSCKSTRSLRSWQRGVNLGHAIQGTAIAATTWGTSPTHMRVYFQDQDSHIVEKAWDGSWSTGGLRIVDQPPRASLAVTSWIEGDNPSIRLLYSSSITTIKEKAFGENGWYDGGFEQDGVPGSNVAVLPMPTMRVYLQSGAFGTGVTEYALEDKWNASQEALPPSRD